MNKKDKQLVQAGAHLLDLSIREFLHEVPEAMNIEMMITFKHKDEAPEFINPVLAFAIKDGILRVITRSHHIWYYEVKSLRRVMLVPMED